MRLTVNITLDDDTFDEGGIGAASEIRYILDTIASRIEEAIESGQYQTVFDISGNDVGRFRIGEMV